MPQYLQQTMALNLLCTLLFAPHSTLILVPASQKNDEYKYVPQYLYSTVKLVPCALGSSPSCV